MKTNYLVATLLASTLLLSGCGQAEKYPTDSILNFVQSCAAQQGASLEMCSCSMDYVRENMSFDEFVEAETTLTATSEMPKAFIKILAKARQKCQ